jgi:hypothetical protein
MSFETYEREQQLRDMGDILQRVRWLFASLPNGAEAPERCR